MCQKESWEAIFATTEAHSTQRDQPPRMHGPGLWMYEQKEQRVTSVPMIGVNCNLWCPGWDGKDLVGRPEQDPGSVSDLPGGQKGWTPLLLFLTPLLLASGRPPGGRFDPLKFITCNALQQTTQ